MVVESGAGCLAGFRVMVARAGGGGGCRGSRPEGGTGITESLGRASPHTGRVGTGWVATRGSIPSEAREARLLARMKEKESAGGGKVTVGGDAEGRGAAQGRIRAKHQRAGRRRSQLGSGGSGPRGAQRGDTGTTLNAESTGRSHHPTGSTGFVVPSDGRCRCHMARRQRGAPQLQGSQPALRSALMHTDSK